MVESGKLMTPFPNVAGTQGLGRCRAGHGDSGQAVHHSQVITIHGESYRLREKRRPGLMRSIWMSLDSNTPPIRHRFRNDPISVISGLSASS
jgi:hypothetical protein